MEENPAHVPGQDLARGKQEGALSNLDRGDLKSLFYLMTGRPDTHVKAFEDPITVGMNDIKDLSRMLKEKINSLGVEEVAEKFNVTLTESEILEFGGWGEFYNHDWDTSKKVESLTIRWDIFVEFSNYEIPQRHTITVRIAESIGPLKSLRYALSNDPEEEEKLDYDTAPIFCRVDFIDHLISEEVINIVDKWYKGRTKAIKLNPVTKWLKSHRIGFARALHFSVPVFVAGLAVSYCLNMRGSFNSDVLTPSQASDLFIWLFVSLFLFSAAYRLAGMVTRVVFVSLRECGRYSPFNITRGDRNRISELQSENRTSLRKVVVGTLSNFLINLLAAIASFKLLQGS